MYKFNHKSYYYLELRFVIIVIISVIMMIFDKKLDMFLQVKRYTLKPVDLFYCLYDKSFSTFNFTLSTIRQRIDIVAENSALHQELFLKNSELLLLKQYQQENARLRELLNFSLCYNKYKTIANVVYINTDLWNYQIIVNKGVNDNVYIGQPVITDTGVVGQVVTVNSTSSHILLIDDKSHALPVQVQRNYIRMILIGRGCNLDLYAECPKNTDICIGDILVTSGLDGRFPEGYPVATVSNIIINKEEDSIIVYASPTVKFQRLHDVLLI